MELRLDQVQNHTNKFVFKNYESFLDSFTGPIGTSLQQDVWTEPLVIFTAVPGKVPELPVEVVKQLSRDQALAYRWAHAIQSGIEKTSL